MNSIVLLTGLLALVMISGFGTAYAQIIIDPFTGPVAPGAPDCDDSDITDGASIVEGTETDVGVILGDLRRCGVNAVDGSEGPIGSGSDAMMAVRQGAPDDFVCNMDDGVTGTCHLEYGTTNDLELNLGGAAHFIISYRSDADIYFKVLFIDSSAVEVSKTVLLPDTFDATDDFLIALQPLWAANAGFDKNDIDQISLWINVPNPNAGPNFGDQAAAFDAKINLLQISIPVGGEFVGVDTSALLLAGAEMNSYWILPLITVIGVGAFIYSRKRN